MAAILVVTRFVIPAYVITVTMLPERVLFTLTLKAKCNNKRFHIKK